MPALLPPTRGALPRLRLGFAFGLALALALAGLPAATPAPLPAAPEDGIGAAPAQQVDLPPLRTAPVRWDAFTLPDPTGAPRSLAALAGSSATVIVFLFESCPMSKRVAPRLQQLHEREGPQGVRVVGVFIEREDAADAAKFQRDYGLTFPLVLDVGGRLAAELGARVVPEAFLLDREGRVRYAGRIDDGYEVRFIKNLTPSREDLAEAVREVLAGQPVRVPRTLAVGCAIALLAEPAAPPAAAAVAAPEVTYHRDVAPILRAHCMACHSPGSVGPFTLTSYDDAVEMMREGLREILARRMPPAQVDSDVPLVRNNTMAPREVDTIRAWLEAGKPEGDRASAPPLAPLPDFGQFQEGLGPPDIILEQQEPYHLGPVGSDVYRNLVYTLNRDRDLRLRAMQLLPSDRSIVHHALIGYLPHEEAKAALRRHGGPGPTAAEGDRGPGFWDEHGLGWRLLPPRGDGIPLSSFVGAYVPGTEASVYPEEADFILPAGTDILVQMHYHRNGRQSQDNSRVGLWLRKDDKIPPRVVNVQFLHGDMVVIPAGVKNMQVSGSWDVPFDLSIAGIAPHAHFLATATEFFADIPGRGRVLLARVPNWNYDWQQPYTFKEPFPLPKGTRLTAMATFDNSEDNPNNPHTPPQPVFLGEQTTDEMLLPIMMLSADRIIDPTGGNGMMEFWGALERSRLMREFIMDQLPFRVQPDGTVVRVGFTRIDGTFVPLPEPVHPAVPPSVYLKDQP